MGDETSFGWLLVGVGLAVAAAGLVWVFLPSLPWLGRLPGDIRIESEHTRFYFPLTTYLLLSSLLSLVVWLIRQFRG